MQVHLLVFHRAPEALNEHVVAPPAVPVHATSDLLAVEDRGERNTGELRALIAVEDRGLPYRASASPSASMQNSTSSETDTRHASTRRLNQSTMVTR